MAVTKQTGPDREQVGIKVSLTKRGYWLIARTKVDEPYPCRCKGRSCVPRQCPCTGRPDPEAGGGNQRRCCGFRYPARSAEARRVLTGGAFEWAGWR